MARISLKERITIEVIQDQVSIKTVVYQLRQAGIPMVYLKHNNTYTTTDKEFTLVVYKSQTGEIVIYYLDCGTPTHGQLETHRQLASLIKRYHKDRANSIDAYWRTR